MSSHHLLIIFGSNSVWNSLCNNIRHLGLFLAPPPTVRVAVGDGTLALVSRLASMRFLPSVRVLMVVALCGYPLIGNLYNFILRLPNLVQLITKNCILPHDIGIWSPFAPPSLTSVALHCDNAGHVISLAHLLSNSRQSLVEFSMTSAFSTPTLFVQAVYHKDCIRFPNVKRVHFGGLSMQNTAILVCQM